MIYSKKACKSGLRSLGFINNYQQGNCAENLSYLTGQTINLEEIDQFIDSDKCTPEYLDRNGEIINDQSSACELRFKLPWEDANGNAIYGHLVWNGGEYEGRNLLVGVYWGGKKPINLRIYGNIDERSWTTFRERYGIPLRESGVYQYLTTGMEFYNGAGYTHFPNGDAVTLDNCKFVKFSTSLTTKDDIPICGWLTKIGNKFKGIEWGTDEEFKSFTAKVRNSLFQRNFDKWVIGRMVFDSSLECDIFMTRLAEKILEEPWTYKNEPDKAKGLPILMSYLENVLNRLFYEAEVLKYENRIIFNRNKSKIWFDTNLIDRFGNDLYIVGSGLIEVTYDTYITKLELVSLDSMKSQLKEWGFDTKTPPQPPKFFERLDDIVFHTEWELDIRYEHIVDERRERFPEKFQRMEASEVGSKLKTAIKFAQKIAQRDYKFFVPMYYPREKRIQLMMPIFLDRTPKDEPDFVLMLDPDIDSRLYKGKTILGLQEAYQDARLIAQPGVPWLNGYVENFE